MIECVIGSVFGSVGVCVCVHVCGGQKVFFISSFVVLFQYELGSNSRSAQGSGRSQPRTQSLAASLPPGAKCVFGHFV